MVMRVSPVKGQSSGTPGSGSQRLPRRRLRLAIALRFESDRGGRVGRIQLSRWRCGNRSMFSVNVCEVRRSGLILWPSVRIHPANAAATRGCSNGAPLSSVPDVFTCGRVPIILSEGLASARQIRSSPKQPNPFGYAGCAVFMMVVRRNLGLLRGEDFALFSCAYPVDPRASRSEERCDSESRAGSSSLQLKDIEAPETGAGHAHQKRAARVVTESECRWMGRLYGGCSLPQL
jgi:hypothetical protein